MKKLCALLLAALAAALFCTGALAAGAQLGYVTDAAGVLTQAQAAALEQKAREISEQYGCGVYIVTVDDYADYSDAGDVSAAAQEIYTKYGLGLGDDASGELLLLSMSRRDYALIAFGYGNTAFTDYGKDRLADEFLDNFGDDDWFGGFSDYLTKSAGMLETAKAGKPLDAGSDGKTAVLGAVISFALGALLALIVCSILKKSMESVGKKTEASAYLAPGSVTFTDREDALVNVTETRVKIQRNESGSGGGTTVNSGGFSEKSGKF